MSEIPMLYNYQNAVVSQRSPTSMKLQDNDTTFFFKRYLLQKAIAVYKWKLPEHWAEDYFLYVLYGLGYISVVRTDKFGVIPQQCSLQGYDVFYRPTHAVISNPLLSGILNPRIGKQCCIIKLQKDYGSIMDMVSFYATKMALCATSIDVNLMNTRLTYVFGADDKGSAESLKDLYSKITAGEPAVFTNKKLFNEDGSVRWQFFTQDAKQNYIAGELLSDLRKIECEFATAIGIPNANTDKKERMVTDEVNANNDETYTLAGAWLEELQKGCEKVRQMFGIEISVDWRNKPQESEVKEDESDSINSRSVSV